MENSRAAAWARRYLEAGYNPLPSCTDKKRPALRRYAAYRDGAPIPEQWLETWWTPNIQVPTGVVWQLAVIDLDGPSALVRWRALDLGGAPTWTVRTGGGGRHLWYRLDPSAVACPTRRLWGIWDAARSAWARHAAIELKGDRGLVVAPPSRHVDTGVEYRFAPGRCPRDLGPPAPLPAWVLAMPAAVAPATPAPPAPRRPAPRRQAAGRCDRPWHDVLDGLTPGEKLALAVGWGLRPAAAGPNAAGWIACHAVGRDDRRPSASFHPASGYYVDLGPDSVRWNLFDLSVALGAHATWLDCLDDLGARTRP